MKALTIRQLPPEVADAIDKAAARNRTSRNKAVIGLLEQVVRSPKKPVLYHDLDRLAGAWSEKEARDFDRHLAKQRTIDKELWQ